MRFSQERADRIRSELRENVSRQVADYQRDREVQHGREMTQIEREATLEAVNAARFRLGLPTLSSLD